MQFKQFCHQVRVVLFFVQMNSQPITTQPSRNPGMLNLRGGEG